MALFPGGVCLLKLELVWWSLSFDMRTSFREDNGNFAYKVMDWREV